MCKGVTVRERFYLHPLYLVTAAWGVLLRVYVYSRWGFLWPTKGSGFPGSSTGCTWVCSKMYGCILSLYVTFWGRSNRCPEDRRAAHLWDMKASPNCKTKTPQSDWFVC